MTKKDLSLFLSLLHALLQYESPEHTNLQDVE